MGGYNNGSVFTWGKGRKASVRNGEAEDQKAASAGRRSWTICKVRMKKYRSYRGKVGKVAPNLLERNVHAEVPDEKWVTDVTEFSLFGQKVYLSPIPDLCHGELASYSISPSPSPSMYLVTDMLEKAFAKIPDGTGLILHSDQGWQYQMKSINMNFARRASVKACLVRATV